MPSKIRILSEQTINQIAAGEVVENPASVVKELVENALDARATKVVVEIQSGGFQRICIHDDGEGMNRDDALLCFERHATSKIFDASDLGALSTFGFRGEALSSIAAIAKVSLTTATSGFEGTRVEVEGGRVLSCEPCPRNQGTTIEVRSLFYNVPARRAFQRSVAASTSEVVRLFTALSLAEPHVHFELMQDKKMLLCAPSCKKDESLEERLEDVLGKQFFSSAPLKVFFKEGSITIEGYIGEPSDVRMNRTGQYLYLNKRLVSSSQISFAAKEGYGTRIALDRYPLFVLHLSVACDAVDVNVHPQKREVRFKEETKVKESVLKAVSQAFKNNQPTASFSPFFPFSFKEEAPLVFREGESSQEMTLAFTEEVVRKPLAVICDYLLLEEKGKLVIVDLKTAHARILLEMFLKKERAAEQQGLLFPINVALSKEEMSDLELHLEELEAIGFSLHFSGKNSVFVEAIPPFLELADIQELLQQLVEDLSALTKIQERQLAAVAYRIAKGRKKPFVLQEAVGLFEQLLRCRSPYDSPQGNPTMVYLSNEELAQFFRHI